MNTKCKVSLIFLLVLLFTSSPVFSSNPAPALETCRSSRLQQGLESCLRDLQLDKSVARNKLSIALVDITDPSHPQLAEVNGDRMMYAASLPKIAILLGAYERIANGELKLDSETEAKLTRMIRNSSNSAATEMLNLVGKPYLAELLQSPKYRLYDPAHSGGLWVGKDYGKAGAWKRDPLANLSHGATAFQVARFYYLLETGQLVSPEMSLEMKEKLGQPAIQHKFVKGLKSRPEAVIYRKSGSWRQYHADSALIEHNGRRYIAVALAEDSQGGVWLSRLIARLDDLILQSPSS